MVWLAVGATVHVLSFDLPREMVLREEGKTITIQGNLIEKNNRYFITGPLTSLFILLLYFSGGKILSPKSGDIEFVSVLWCAASILALTPG